MAAAALVFLLVFGTILGAYWLFVLRGERQLIRRLAPRRRAATRLLRSMVKTEEQMSSVRVLRQMLEEQGWAERLHILIDQSELRLTVSRLLLLMGCAGLGAYLLAMAATGLLIVALAIGAVAASLPYWYVARARARRLLKFEEQFPDAIDLIARSLRAGHALPTGLSMVAEEMPAPVGPEFRILYDEQNYGLTLPDALRNFARRIPVLDARFFVTAVLTQRESGGNLAEVLDNLSAVIRERFKVRRQVRVISAHGRVTGWVLALLPPALALAMLILNPGHLNVMVADPLGQQMITVGVILQIVGTLVIRRIVRVKY